MKTATFAPPPAKRCNSATAAASFSSGSAASWKRCWRLSPAGKARSARPCAGSTFKRPAGNYASALVDRCGLKGLAVGGAEVSQKHAGFIINRGGATAAEVLQLIAEVQRTVREKTGYELECEVKYVE